jgi:hypothetical protein
VSDTSYDPTEQDFDPVSFIQRQRRATMANALTSLDASPEDAARAQDLSKATGAPPALVYGNLDGFEQQHKASLTATLLKNNQFLAEYADSHPLAAKVSNDDWGNLDSLSQSLQKMWGRGQPRGALAEGVVEAAPETVLAKAGQGILGGAVAGAQEGFGDELPGRYLSLDNQNRLAWAINTTLGGLGETVPRLVNAGVGAGVGAYLEFLNQMFGQERYPGDVTGFMNSALPGLIGAEGSVHPEAQEVIKKAGDVYQNVKHFIDEGKIPPVGVDPIVDDLHKEQAKLDIKGLDENLKEASSTATRERSSELLKNFIDQHTDGRIGINAEAIQRLYGDKLPEVDDGILGFIPDLQQQIVLAASHGGDVEVGLGDWLAKVDPEVAKELHDFIRVRPGGMTLEETKEPTKEVEEPETIKSPAIQLKSGEIIEGKSHLDAMDQLKERLGKADIIDEIAPTETGMGGFTTSRGRLVDREEAARIQGKSEVPGFLRTSDLTAVDSLRRSAGLEPQPLPQQFTVQVSKPILPTNATPSGVEISRGETKVPTIASFQAKDILPNLDKSKLSPITRKLADFFTKHFSTELGNVDFHVVNEADMAKLSKANGWDFTAAGFYNSDENHIVLHEAVVNGKFSGIDTANIVLHELSHAATSDALDASPELFKHTDSVRQEVMAQLIKVDPDSFHEFNYAFQNPYEFMAEAFSNPRFQEVLSAVAIDEKTATRLNILGQGKITAWDAVRDIVRRVFEKIIGTKVDNSALDAVLQIGKLTDMVRGVLTEGKKSTVRAIKPPETPLGKGIVPRTEKYMELIAKQNEEDLKFQKEQAEKSERQRQTAEWKTNFTRLRAEEAERIRQRPDIAADTFLRTGELPNGEKFQKIKLDSTKIDPALRERTPQDYLARGGMDPDALAGHFGYQSGDALVRGLAKLADERELEDLTPKAHINRIIDAETDRRMRKEYGNLEQNILDEAKDHVLSQTQMDLLHEETVALGMQSKAAAPLSKDALKAALKEQFDKTPTALHSSDKYMAAAGRAGARAEKALLENNPTEAYKAKQEQYHSTILASLARKLEKERDQFDKRVKNWRRRTPSGVDQEDAVWIHQILGQIGLPPMRLVQDLDRQKDLVSPYKNLREYVTATNEMHELANTDVDAVQPTQRLNVADFLFTDNYRSTVDEMTPAEFRDVFNSLKSIDHYARETKKLDVKGKKEDLNEVVSGLVARLKAAVNDKPITDEVRQKQSAGRLVGTWLLNPETWMNRLDLGNRLGPFNQLIIRPITEGQYLLRTFERDFAKQWKDLGDFPDLRKKIENTIFKDPQSGDLVNMTKENAYAVLQNMGNELQRKKLVLGWKVHKDVEQGTQMIWQWLAGVGIKAEDLARAQKMGDMFDKAFSLSEKAYTHVAGVAPERIELKTVQTPWGEQKEWYHPLIPDPLRHSSKLTVDDMIGDSGYFRPSPSAGYTKTRTGATYPIDLTFDSVPFKLKQILNDAAMRVPVNEVSKIVYHNNFKAAFKKYYGQEYAGALDAWMKDVAGNRQWVPSNLRALDKAVNTLQQNLSTLLIGWNLGTVAKHAPTAAVFSAAEVGPIRFAQSAFKMLYQLPGSREAWGFMMENSEELQNRMRSMEDTLIAQNRESFKKLGWKGKYANFRDVVEWYGHFPVAATDLISAVAMGHAEYLRLAEEQPDLSHGDIMNLVNTAIRRTHGSSILSNRPGIMRYNSPFARLIMPFYNFMSNALQRNYELAWKTKLAMQGRDLPEMKGFEEEQFKAGPQHIKSIIGGLMVYGVMVSLIEQKVDPLPDDPKSSRVGYWAKVLTRGYPSMIPVVRDAVNFLEQGHEPSIGLYGTFARNVDKALDHKSYTHNPGQTFRTLNTLFGTLTGLTFEPIGRAGEFTFNVAAGVEHPKGMGDLFKGLYHGTLKESRK